MSNSKITKIQTFLKWLDSNIMLLLAGFLIAFIPLYPKLPLFDIIPGYIVRVRLEDIFVAIACLIWLIQVKRKKIEWKNSVFYFIAAYIFVAFLSLLSGVFIIKTIPLEAIHFGKSFLHFLRYIEYFALFFITFSSIKSIKDTRTIVTIFALTVLGASIYGWGQKYYYWPVYSTMNREFSKGMRLYLTEHARVQSTFGGHYDLAAYLVIVLCLLLTLAYKEENKTKKIFYHLVHLAGLWLMIVAASRTSFVSYLIASLLVILMIAVGKDTIGQKLKWGINRFILLTFSILILIFFFGQDMSERLIQVVDNYPIVTNTYAQLTLQKQQFTNWIAMTFDFQEADVPKDGMSVEELQQQLEENNIIVPTDQRPVPEKPEDVYIDVPDYMQVATISATGEKIIILVEKERTWSQNAIKYGLSMAIRLDTLWPNAIKGFKRNPILGSSYATLNKETFQQFTEAESTDNNYLRTLGETGILGFISFYGGILLCLNIAKNFIRDKDYFISALSIGFIAASIGLLINATYIDVFAASKVAFTYWSLAGMTVGSYYLKQNKKTLKKIYFRPCIFHKCSWYERYCVKILQLIDHLFQKVFKR